MLVEFRSRARAARWRRCRSRDGDLCRGNLGAGTVSSAAQVGRFDPPTAPMGLADTRIGSPVVAACRPPNPGHLACAADAGSFSRPLEPSAAVDSLRAANPGHLPHDPADCPDGGCQFGAIVDAARNRDGLGRVGEVNRAVNLALRPVSDQEQYGAPDIWASPLMTFGSGAGDCEDYAIAKYVALREAGMASADLRLVVVYNRPAHENHMVAAARVDGRWRILDNRTMRLVADARSPIMRRSRCSTARTERPPSRLRHAA